MVKAGLHTNGRCGGDVQPSLWPTSEALWTKWLSIQTQHSTLILLGQQEHGLR